MRAPIAYRLLEVMRGMDTVKWANFMTAHEAWELEDFRAYQFHALKKLLQFVSVHVPYYREYFSHSRMSDNAFSSLSDLVKLPVVSKKDYHQGQFQSDSRPAGKIFRRSTSGSTGEPFIYYLDRDSFSIVRAMRLCSWQQFGYTLGEKYMVVAGGSLINNQLSRWASTAYDLLDNRIACPVTCYDHSTGALIIQNILHYQPKVVLGYPSILSTLAQQIKANATAMPKLKAVVTTSECLHPSERRAIEEGFGTRVYDFYGLADGTLMACECHRHEGLHYFMEGAILECVDENGSPVPEEVEGRLLATSLTNYYMPFIRYDTGDVGMLSSAPCACGRRTVRITQISGRDRDQIVAANDGLVHGAVINKIASKFSWIIRFQIVQHENRRIDVLVSPSCEPTDIEINAFINALTAIVGDIPIKISFTDSFILTKSGKFRCIVSFRPH